MPTSNFPAEYFQLMSDYNRWMNDKLYASCATLSDEERKRDRGAFFRSIHSTLNHLLWGDSVWLARFTERGRPSGKAGEDMHPGFDDLRAARAVLDDDIARWATSVTPDWLAGEITWTSGIDGKTRRRPAWVCAVHMFNHQTHHRGQVTALMKQAGVDPGVTDLPALPRFAELD